MTPTPCCRNCFSLLDGGCEDAACLCHRARPEPIVETFDPDDYVVLVNGKPIAPAHLPSPPEQDVVGLSR